MSVIHITANSRLTQTLKQQAFLAQSSTVAETPHIMTLAQWWQQWEQACLLRGELQESDFAHKRLSTFEAQLVWEQVLEKESAQRFDEQGEPLALLNLSTTAKQLNEAWSLWMEWLDETQRQQTEDMHFDSQEVALFKKAAQHYQSILEQHDWQDESLRQQSRLQWLAEGKGRIPKRIELHGFDELTPLLRRWQGLLEQRGCDVVMAEDSVMQVSPQRYVYQARDSADEVQQAAFWCVQQWLALQKTQPLHTIKIGVVAPNLADYKSALSQQLDEQLALAFQQPLNLQSPQRQTLYNFSLGVSLSEVPIVKNALQSVKILCQPKRRCAYEEWSQWLISPYTAEDIAKRQQADSKLRRLQWASFRWPTLIESDAAQALPKGLLKRLQNWQQFLEKQPTSSMGIRDFVELAESCFERLGWAQSRSLNSDEYQQKQTFMEVLAQFKQLTSIQQKQSVDSWLAVLQRFVSETVHQSQSRGLQPIQVMGMLEAGGQQFDALWVLGMTDEAWPRMPSPNPFLSMDLQRQYNLPRCDAQRELKYAHQVTQRLCQAAPQQVWSFAAFLGEAEMLASPLLESRWLAESQPFMPQAYQSLAHDFFSRRSDLQWELDNRGPEIPAGSHAPGGSGILQAQSKCPLMAFLDFRLGARNGLQDVEEGLQSTNQGTLVHEILEQFWQETRTQSNLLMLSGEQVAERLQTQIENRFDALKNAFDGAYLKLEQDRIMALLLQWLEVEKQRPPFAVAETERETFIELAGIEFRIVIDRIDLVEGQKVILDYKTGKASVGDLMKFPIKAPQLAVYLHAMEEQDTVSGIGYGLLHSDDGVSLNALVDEEGILSKLRSVTVFAKKSAKEGDDFYGVHWNDFLDSLRQEVLDLAKSIQQGVADMTFDKPADVAYAASLLALRLPEVEAQLAEAGICQEALE